MLKKILLPIAFIIFGSLLFISCAEKEDALREAEKFTSIFDNNTFNSTYRPIDMQQTADGGYIVLGERRIPLVSDGDDNDDNDSRPTGIYLLKADKNGNFIKFLEPGDSLVNPIGKFTTVGDKLYFFCMQSTTSTGTPAQAKLASVDANLDGFAITSLAGLSYPAAASYITNRFVLLSYNYNSRESVVSEVSIDGVVGKQKGFNVGIGDASEEPILGHYLKTGKQYPFEVGLLADGIYYFNGFYDFTFSLVFTDLNEDKPMGVVQGQNDDGGLSAITPLSASKFAAARFNFGDNYFLPNTTLKTIGNSSSISLGGKSLRELLPDAKVKILRATINTKNVLIYASDTQTRQIGLYFYDEATGDFLSSRYLGFSNPFEIANLITTADGGIAVCGTAYLAGRFPRISIFKLSKDDVAENVK